MIISNGHILRGNSVRFVTPSAEPQGPLLSLEALHGLSSGQRKATGPMTVPSALAPWTSALALMASEATVARVVVKRILNITESQRLELGW